MHHVTSRAFVVDPDNNGNPDDAGARWLPGETFTDGANGITVTVDSETAEGYVVTISVTDPGHIVLDPASLAFTTQQGTDPASQTFAIQNTGIGELQWTASDDATWIDARTRRPGTTASAGSSDRHGERGLSGLAPGLV